MIKLIICLISILIILFVGIYKKEGLLNYNDYNSIDRIKIQNTNTSMYAYCIGGNVFCPSGNVVKLEDYKGGKTYNSVCNNNTPVVCNNFMNSNKTTNLDISGEKYLWKTPKGISFPFSTIYKGFTYPVPYMPITLNGNYFSIYDSSNNLLDSINKCTIVNDTYRCEMVTHSLDNSYGDSSFVDVSYTEPPNIYQETLTLLDQKTENITEPKDTECLADYGSQIGDNLCDGAIGLLKDPAFICPYYKPICDYKCGSSLGKCNYKSKI